MMALGALCCNLVKRMDGRIVTIILLRLLEHWQCIMINWKWKHRPLKLDEALEYLGVPLQLEAFQYKHIMTILGTPILEI